MFSTTLSGITFADLPYIRSEWRDTSSNEYMPSGANIKMWGEPCTIVREVGELWDSEAQPAYSVRMGLKHIGYIPLLETINFEREKAKEGWRKVWKDGYDGLTKEELRAASQALIEKGELPCFHDWEFVGTETTKKYIRGLSDKAENLIVIREQLYTDYHCNPRMTPCHVVGVYWDDIAKKVSTEEAGEICSVKAYFNIDG